MELRYTLGHAASAWKFCYGFLSHTKSEELFGGRFIVEIDPVRASQQLLEHITQARKKLGLIV